MSAADLRNALKAAGLNVREDSGWASRGSSWSGGKPSGVMHHHTAPPVPFPINRLNGSGDGRIKCNINTKPDGTVWLVAYRACNYSSGSGSSVVLAETQANKAPPSSAKARGLADDINGNTRYWNFENDAPGDGSPLPQNQWSALVAATRVVNAHFNRSPNQVIAHAEWTARKIDPKWNGKDANANLNEIRSALKGDNMEKVPVQDWARSAYQWAINTRPTQVYKANSVDEIRETIDDQREMVFLWRAVSNMEVGGGSGGIDFGTTVKLTKP